MISSAREGAKRRRFFLPSYLSSHSWRVYGPLCVAQEGILLRKGGRKKATDGQKKGKERKKLARSVEIGGPIPSGGWVGGMLCLV